MRATDGCLLVRGIHIVDWAFSPEELAKIIRFIEWRDDWRRFIEWRDDWRWNNADPA